MSDFQQYLPLLRGWRWFAESFVVVKPFGANQVEIIKRKGRGTFLSTSVVSTDKNMEVEFKVDGIPTLTATPFIFFNGFRGQHTFGTVMAPVYRRYLINFAIPIYSLNLSFNAGMAFTDNISVVVRSTNPNTLLIGESKVYLLIDDEAKYVEDLQKVTGMSQLIKTINESMVAEILNQASKGGAPE